MVDCVPRAVHSFKLVALADVESFIVCDVLPCLLLQRAGWETRRDVAVAEVAWLVLVDDGVGGGGVREE